MCHRETKSCAVTYLVTWYFDNGKVWSKGGYTLERAIEVKEMPLKYGLPVKSASMEPERAEKKESVVLLCPKLTGALRGSFVEDPDVPGYCLCGSHRREHQN